MKGFFTLLASGFGSGYSPVAPGTAGAALACLVLWGLHALWPDWFPGDIFQAWEYLLFILFFLLIGVWASNKVEGEWGHDASRIVIDEMVGMWLTMVFVPFTWYYLLLGFGLFRFFDISKVLGIRKAEKFPRGWGVMLDDVLAGLYANLVLQATAYYLEPVLLTA